MVFQTLLKLKSWLTCFINNTSINFPEKVTKMSYVAYTKIDVNMEGRTRCRITKLSINTLTWDLLDIILMGRISKGEVEKTLRRRHLRDGIT